jgi:hypothetical protein
MHTLTSRSQEQVAFVCMAYFVPDLKEIKLLWYIPQVQILVLPSKNKLQQLT